MASAGRGRLARPGRPSRPPPRVWRGRLADGIFAARGGGPGDGRVPVPSDDRAGRPEARIGLLALRAGQPAQGVDAPADADRAGTRVGLAQRRGIGTPGDARPHLAPHDRHPQFIADHSPHGTCSLGRNLGAGRLGRGFRRGRSCRRGRGFRRGRGSGAAVTSGAAVAAGAAAACSRGSPPCAGWAWSSVAGLSWPSSRISASQPSI